MEPPSPRASALDGRTLVLNRAWVPIHVTSVRRALVMMFRQAAVAVRPATYETFDFESWSRRGPLAREPVVRTVSRMIPAPEVILLAEFDRLPRRQVPFTRRNLSRRDHLRCQYCGRRPGPEHLTIDHVLPRSQGGSTGWSNCVLACIPCNRKKGGKTPEQAGMRLLASPTRPDWVAAFGQEAAPSGWDGFLRPARNGAAATLPREPR